MSLMNVLRFLARFLVLSALGAGAAGVSAAESVPMHEPMASSAAATEQEAMPDPCCGLAHSMSQPCEDPSLCAAQSLRTAAASAAGTGSGVGAFVSPRAAPRASPVRILAPPDQALRFGRRKLSVLFCSFQT